MFTRERKREKEKIRREENCSSGSRLSFEVNSGQNVLQECTKRKKKRKEKQSGGQRATVTSALSTFGSHALSKC